jgi:hypothetical protein
VDTAMLSVLFKLNNVATGATMVFRSQLCAELLPIPDSWVHDAWIVWLAALQGSVGILPRRAIAYRIHQGQQLGLDPPTLRARIAHSQRHAVNGYISLIRQFEDLRGYLEKKNDSRLAEFLPGVDAKIRLLRSRASLTGTPMQRVGKVLPSWRDYQLYARGPISLLKDLVLPSSSAGLEKRGAI